MNTITNINFQSQYNNLSSNKKYADNYNKRLMTMGTGMLLGTGAALCYYKNKQKNKVILRSLEFGAMCGLTADLFKQVSEIPENIKQEKIQNIDIEPYKDKNFFITLYSGNGKITPEFLKNQELLSDKNIANQIFQNKEVLQASQQALLEINNQKMKKAITNNDISTANELKMLNALLDKNNKTIQDKTKDENKNVSFKAIWNMFHKSNESLRHKAEVVVNRYSSSAAATAAALANTGIGDAAALTLITKNMCKKIFKIYDCSGSYVAAITTASVGAVLGTNLATKGATIWPGAGNAINATITYTLHQLEGRALIEFLEEYGDELGDCSDADAVAKYATRVKSGLGFIENDKVREQLEKVIDKTFNFLF